jgi:hypothetical protein
MWPYLQALHHFDTDQLGGHAGISYNIHKAPPSGTPTAPICQHAHVCSWEGRVEAVAGDVMGGHLPGCSWVSKDKSSRVQPCMDAMRNLQRHGVTLHAQCVVTFTPNMTQPACSCSIKARMKSDVTCEAWQAAGLCGKVIMSNLRIPTIRLTSATGPVTSLCPAKTFIHPRFGDIEARQRQKADGV